MKRLAFGSWPFIHGSYEKQPVGFHKLLHQLQDNGYAGVELGAYRPHPTPESHDTPERRAELRQELAEHDLAFSGLAPNLKAHSLVSLPHCDLYVSAFTRFADFAAEVGAKAIRVDTVEPTAKLEPLGLKPEVILERAVRAFAACSQRAADRGLSVCWEFEPHLPLHKPPQIVAVVDAVRGMGHANFCVLYDAAHAHICSDGKELELVKLLDGRIGHVHLCDTDGTQDANGISRHLPFGAGRIDFTRLLPELARMPDGDDWWVVDMCYQPDAWTAISTSRKFLAPFLN